MTTNTIVQEEFVEVAEMKSGDSKKGYFKTKIVWFNLFGFLTLHVIGIAGGFYCLLKLKFLTVLWVYFLIFMSGLGITVGAHRLFTHRCYKAVWGFRLFLVIMQTIAGQNCLYIWVRDHRQHHKYSDTDADPHNSQRGFFFSHMGWLMMKKHPDVRKTLKNIDLCDLEADPLVMFQKKYYNPLYVVFAVLIPVSLPVLVWNESIFNAIIVCFFTRYIILLNGTWMVNSWAHFFGTRPYNKNIPPVEALLVSAVALGEGWHNYHHSFPWDYRTSEYGSIFNPSTVVIDLAAKFGWAYDLRKASKDMIRVRVEAHGDGNHQVWGNSVLNTSNKLEEDLDPHKDDGYASVTDEIQPVNERPNPPEYRAHNRKRRYAHYA